MHWPIRLPGEAGRPHPGGCSPTTQTRKFEAQESRCQVSACFKGDRPQRVCLQEGVAAANQGGKLEMVDAENYQRNGKKVAADPCRRKFAARSGVRNIKKAEEEPESPQRSGKTRIGVGGEADANRREDGAGHVGGGRVLLRGYCRQRAGCGPAPQEDEGTRLRELGGRRSTALHEVVEGGSKRGQPTGATFAAP